MRRQRTAGRQTGVHRQYAVLQYDYSLGQLLDCSGVNPRVHLGEPPLHRADQSDLLPPASYRDHLVSADGQVSNLCTNQVFFLRLAGCGDSQVGVGSKRLLYGYCTGNVLYK